MDFRRYEITADDAGRRVDRVVRRFLPGISLSAVYKLLRKGLIRVDGKRVSPDRRAEPGNILMISPAIGDFDSSPPDTRRLDPSEPPPAILETEDLLFVNKPVGIPVHGDGGLDALIPSSSRADRSLSFRTGPLHRLDRDTSGVIAFSRSLDGARWFTEGGRNRSFGKYYLGIARGSMVEAARWRDVDDDGREMITEALPLERSADGAFTLVRYRIVTGRKHQIRIQTSLRGHPLAGDRRYEDGERTDCSRSRPTSAATPPSGVEHRTYFLHAWILAFGEDRLPGLPDCVRAPLPDAFARAIETTFGVGALFRAERGDLLWGEHEKP